MARPKGSVDIRVDKCKGCLLCVSVCPNRALVGFETVPGRYPVLSAVRLPGKVEMDAAAFFVIRQKYQLVHVVDFCNACGNCATFCPTAGAPYRDKLTLFAGELDFGRINPVFTGQTGVVPEIAPGVAGIPGFTVTASVLVSLVPQLF